MRFEDIKLINGLWVVALLIVFYFWVFRKREKDGEKFAKAELLENLTLDTSYMKRKIKIALMLFIMVFFVFSLMRPQWGEGWKEVKRKGLDILIAIDTSKSMLAEDVKPNRLERSKLAVKDLIKKIKGDRLGLIAFSGGAFLQCPLTIDYNGFMIFLDDLNINSIPKGSTSLASAIDEAIESYEGGLNKYKILILITDGEGHVGDPIKAAQKAKKNGIKIFTVGIGNKEGDLIPVIDGTGKRGYLKDKKGNFIKSRLNEDVLKKIAAITGGGYVKATGLEFGLDLIYENKLSKMDKRDFDSKLTRLYEEKFQIPLFIAFLLLITETFIRERKSGL